MKEIRYGIKLPLVIALAGTIILGALILTASVKVGSITRGLSEKYTASEAESLAKDIEGSMEDGMSSARSLAEALEGMVSEDKGDRETANAILKKVLGSNDSFIGIWTCWEPDAFDGRDRLYRNTPGHDATGRYIPYIFKDSGRIGLVPLEGYDQPGPGDCYLVPKRTGRETVMPPYEYKVGDEMVRMVSLVAPITIDGAFAGVAGVDMEIGTLSKQVTGLKLFGTGNAQLIDNSGHYVASNNAEQIGKDIAESGVKSIREKAKAAIKEGKRFEVVEFSNSMGKDVYSSYVPVHVGKAGEPWSVVVKVPVDTVYAQAISLTKLMFMFGLAALAALATLGWLISRSVVHGIRRTVGIAGDLTGAAVNGMLDFRAVETDVPLDFRPIITGFNGTMDAVVKPVREAAQVLDKLAAMDLTARMSTGYKGEFNAISENMNHATESLDMAIGTIREIAGKVVGSAEIVSQAVSEVGRASSEVANGAQEVAMGAGRQTNIASDASAAMNQLKRAIDEVARGAQEQATGAEEAALAARRTVQAIERINEAAATARGDADMAGNEARNGANSADGMIRGMELVKTSTDEISVKINALNNASRRIGDMLWPSPILPTKPTSLPSTPP